ncbi:hypothetical protein, partial [Klebsiella pneumoniae]|uniref:hypothetical protein n=1 Tax=Klebsiella pneumoniae TaxID=573 RepID=UPI003EE2713E
TPLVTKRVLILLTGLLAITLAIVFRPTMPDSVTSATTVAAKQAAMENLSWWTLHGGTVCWVVVGLIVFVLA